MPRQRTARLPVLTSSAPRHERPRSGGGRSAKPRLVALALVVLSLVLITVYFRESTDGALHGAQRIGVSILAPFEVAAERVARPFRDAWNYASDLFEAKSENERLEEELEALREEAIRNESAVRENEELRLLLEYRDGDRFPDDFRAVATRVIGHPASPYSQRVLVAAGSEDGVRLEDPVVTDEGLVGLVTDVAPNAARVTLLTDQQSAASALVSQTGAAGVVRHGPSDGTALVLDRVGKDELVEKGHLVITAGWRTGEYESVYPKGIPIGVVASVSNRDVDLYKRVQVTPLVDFDSLDEVIVLVKERRRG